jgi:hypothetical protein
MKEKLQEVLDWLRKGHYETAIALLEGLLVKDPPAPAGGPPPPPPIPPDS